MPPERTNEEGAGDGEVIDVLAPDAAAAAAEKAAAAAAQQDGGAADPAPREEARREERSGNADDQRVPRRRDDDDDDYSRRVRTRINREIALRERAENRLNEVISSNEEMRDRLLRVERRQAVSETTGDSKKKIADIELKIAAVTTKLAAALEGGDTKAQLDLNIEMSNLIADKKLLEARMVDQTEAARRAAETADAGSVAEEDQDPQMRRIARMSSKWQTANRKWWNLRRFSDIKRDAVELDKDLRQEVSDGKLDMEEYSEDYFAELSIRLKDLYPDLDVRGLDGERIEAESDDLDRDARNHRDDQRDDRDSRDRDRDRDRNPRRRPAAGGMGTGDRRRAGGDPKTLAEQGRVRLTEADYAQMRQYGLDPNNPDQKKAFAKERMRTILTGDRDPRGGGVR